LKTGYIVPLLLVCLLGGCENQSPNELGNVNGRSIRPDEFVFSYETSPRSITAGPKETAYEQVLDRLMERILLSQESRRRGLDKEPEIARELKYLEDAAIRRELFRENIRRVTEISEEDARLAFSLAQKTLWIQHVELDSLITAKPDVWNPDWKHVPINLTLSNVEVRGLGSVNLVGWNDVDTKLESILYQLELKEWTAPILKNGQSHLFRLLNVQTNQMTSESQFSNEREHYQSAIRKRVEHDHSFAFVQETMKPEKLTIKRQVLEQLTQALWAYKIDSDNLSFRAEGEIQLENLTLDDIGTSELAHFESGSFTVDDFRFFYKMNPQKLEANNPGGLRHKLVNTIGIYVRDLVFAEIGRNEGLHKRHEVVQDYQYWQERLLASRLEQHIHELSMPESGTDTEAAEDIASRAVAELSISLRGQAEISVNKDLLMTLKTSDEGLSRKIDLFTSYLN